VSLGSDGGDAGDDVGDDALAEAEAGDATLVDASSDVPAIDAADAADVEAGFAPFSDDAGTDAAPIDVPGVAYGEITSSVRLPAIGTLDVALVAGGAASCVNPRFVAKVTLDAGKHVTVAMVGLLADVGADASSPARALSLVALTDDGTVEPESARVRLVHAALGLPGTAYGPVPALSASVKSSDGGAGVEIAAEIDPKHASLASGMPPVDALGYSTVSPVEGQPIMSFRALGDASVVSWWTHGANLDLLQGTLHTGFIVSRPVGGLALIWCSDAATAVSASPAPCEIFEAARF
jgi:hypothetical protein